MFPEPSNSAADPFEQWTWLVHEVLEMHDSTLGARGQGWLARYRGRLRGDSAAAYDRLAQALQPYGVTPLFREEDGQHVIYLVREAPRAATGNPRVNLLFFLLTLWSVLFVGALMEYSARFPLASSDALLGRALRNPLPGWPFALSLLAILLAHEFGHYFAGRYHGVRVTLPYFIPFPFGILGTLGAFIQMKEVPKNRRVLLDIGIAGPLAGLVVAIPVTLYGLSISPLGHVQGGLLEGNSLLYLFSKWLVFGRLLPEPLSYQGLPPALYWLRYFFTGSPLPVGGLDVQLSSVALAGWAGLLVTAMNLIPVGQLDGGHVFYVLFGRRAALARPVILILLVGLGYLWPGWWTWAVLLFFLGGRHAEVLDEITPLDPRRRWLGVLALIVFLLVFPPIPMLALP